jgi:exonuclease SbcC
MFKGSTWRKWDLHVHSIYTNGNSHYSCGMDILAKKIQDEKLDGVGLTNYFIIHEKEYNELKKALDDIGCSTYLVPNFEFRINEKNKSGEYINVHILFNPETTTIKKIHNSLNRVPLSNISGTDKYCTSKDIEEFGYSSVTVAFKDLIEQLDKDFKCLKDYFIVGVNKGYGGSSPGGSSRDQELAKKIDEWSHLFFTSKSEDRDFFLNKTPGRGELGLPAKPIVIASDAHKIGDVGKQYSWIKGDATFEGLKQILHEPEFRINIEQRIPDVPIKKIEWVELNFPSNTKIVHVTDRNAVSSESTFCLSGKRKIAFSPHFTCVIGGRGSGKSTILNLIAEKLLGGTDFFKTNKLKVNGKTIDPVNHVEVEGFSEIEFISQNEVEKFANSEELTDAIYDRLRDRNFDEFKRLENQNSTDIIRLKDQIENINKENQLKNTNIDLEKELKEAKKIVDHYSSDSYKRLTSEISKLTKAKNDLEVSRNYYQDLISRIKEIEEEFRFNLIDSDDNSDAEIDAQKNAYDVAILEILDKLKELSRDRNFEHEVNEIDRIEKELTKVRKELDDYMKSQGVSEEDSTLYERSVQRIPVVQSEIKSNKLKLAELQREIKKFNDNSQELEVNRNNFENALINALVPLNQQMVSSNTNVADIRFEYRYDYNAARKEILNRFEKQFDFANVTEFNTRRNAVEDYLFCIDPFQIESQDKYLSELEGFRGDANAKELVKSVLIDSVNFKTYKLIIESVEQDILTHKKIIGFYGNKEFKKCSFGQKCTAVIVALITFGNKPIIIDEPEAHLDSKLIAEYLVHLIKKKKANRQIIFATHNANFVVNADSELIHSLSIKSTDNLTNILPITVENIKHRDKLLSLEGGQEAFELRDRKLL